MSAKSIRAFEQDQAARGRPVRRRLSMRQEAAKLREHAARLLALANELDESADAAGEPK